MSPNDFCLAGKTFNSRLFTGTGKFSSLHAMQEAIKASGSQLVTLALRRIELGETQDELLNALRLPGVSLLPNTSGVRTAKEAVFAAHLAREALGTSWIKLEIHPDPRYLLPDPIETLEATRILVQEGFVVLPYIQADPVLCKRLEDVGAQAVMPLGSPIGSNQGLKTKTMLKIIIEQSQVPVIIDAGIGAPSQACEAMELGASAVLVNTAISIAQNPVTMAQAFASAVQCGRLAYTSGLGPRCQGAHNTSPLTSFLDN